MGAPLDGWIPLTDLIRHVGIHRVTLVRLAKRGELDASFVDGRWWVAGPTADAFAAGYRHPQPLRAHLSTETRILSLLHRVGRASAAELAGVLGLSTTPIYEHLRRLAEEGLIYPSGRADRGTPASAQRWTTVPFGTTAAPGARRPRGSVAGHAAA